MQVIYCRSLTVGGFLIRAGQGFGQWSHAGVLLPEGVVVSARALKGVVPEPLAEFRARYSKCDIVDKRTPNDEAGYALARQAVAERWRYGYGKVWNFITNKLGRNTRADQAHCIELVERCLVAAGRAGDDARFDVAPAVISPQQSYITR